jgi:hypothetical protein
VRRAAPDDMTVGAKPKPPVLVAEEPAPTNSRWPLVAAGLVVLVLGLAGAVWFFVRPAGPRARLDLDARLPRACRWSLRHPRPPQQPEVTPPATSEPGVAAVGADTPDEPAVPSAHEDREERSGHRRVRTTGTTMSTTSTTMETSSTGTTTTTTMTTAPPPEDDEVIPSPYQ